MEDLTQYHRQEIERFWQGFVDMTKGMQNIKTLRDAISLRTGSEQALEAYRVTFEHNCLNDSDLRDFPTQVKDGFVRYASFCRARAVTGYDWIKKLQGLIEES